MRQPEWEDLFRSWLYAGLCVSITGGGLLAAQRLWLPAFARPAGEATTGLAFLDPWWFFVIAIVAIELATATGYAWASIEWPTGFIGAHLAMVSWWIVIVSAGPDVTSALVIAPAVCVGAPLLLGLAWAIFPRRSNALGRD